MTSFPDFFLYALQRRLFLTFYERNGFNYIFSTENQEREFQSLKSDRPLNGRLMYFDLIELVKDNLYQILLSFPAEQLAYKIEKGGDGLFVGNRDAESGSSCLFIGLDNGIDKLLCGFWRL